MLQYKYTNQDDIPEKYRDLYTERDGVFILTGISGIKTQDDVDRLQDSLRKEREDHKDTKGKLRKFGDRDPDEILADLDKIDEYKLAAEGKMDEQKIEQVVQARLRSAVAPIERERDQYKNKLSENEERLGEFEHKDRIRTIHDKVRSAGSKAKIRDTAMHDALALSEAVFTVAEDGRVVTRDGVGVTPGIEPEVWFTELQSTRPHWWPESRGAGATGGAGGAGGKNPFSKEHWNLTEQGNIIRENRSKAEQLASAAGTKIGGPRPS